MLNFCIPDTEKLILKNLNVDTLKAIFEIHNNTISFKYATGIQNEINFNNFSARMREFISKKNSYFLTVNCPDRGLVGFVKGLVENDISWINSLAIDVPYQLNGYGKETVKILEHYLKTQLNVEKIFLSVAKENTGGINFWLNCKYSPCDYDKNGKLLLKNKAIIMKKSL